jgi:uroporphyrinogen-III synthase
VDPDQVAELHGALEDLESHTHIAFTSKNGIYAVLHELERLQGDAAQQYVRDSGVQLCALGADAHVLEAAGYEVHVTPAEPSTQGLVRELQERGELDGARVLCPVPHVTGERT